MDHTTIIPTSMTAVQFLTWTACAVAALATYLAASFGPYLVARDESRKKTVKDIIDFSLANPAGFEIWLREHQIKRSEEKAEDLEISIKEAQKAAQKQMRKQMREQRRAQAGLAVAA